MGDLGGILRSCLNAQRRMSSSCVKEWWLWRIISGGGRGVGGKLRGIEGRRWGVGVGW